MRSHGVKVHIVDVRHRLDNESASESDQDGWEGLIDYR
jgi:hypothetical protein